ncbi:shikimate dehydrogenase [Herbiconiux sp. P17]|uniref:shikimate dehydrogenase n=1 Tax=Herbiconiux wuyangfengii TaxID=3342794 RepID=UPI0035BA407B
MTSFTPASGPTMYFIGVSTGKSSIMDVFPAWAQALGVDATISGIDLPLDAAPASYREVVSFIKNDPLSLGALVTTHKLNIVTAARDLFDGFGDDAQLLGEISSIAKRPSASGPDELWGNAMDPVTSGLSLEAIVPDDHWSRTGGDLVLLGAGGSSLALTLYLHKRMLAGHDVPQRIVVTNRRPGRLEEMRAVHERLGSTLPLEYVEAADPSLNDRVVDGAREASVVVNATGLGKDRPGSPLTDAVVFPSRAVAWDFNYRGDLVFLDQARAQDPARDVRVVDGWFYFLHGWTRVIADVFHLDIPTHGPEFERLSEIARTAGKKGIPA